jgi:hypothetical protein
MVALLLSAAPATATTINRRVVACNSYAHVKCVTLQKNQLVGFVRTSGMTTTIYLFTATGGEGEHYTIEACAVTDGEYMPRQCGSTPSVDHATAPIQSVGGSGLSQRVAHNLHVRIVNNTSREIIALLASPTANDKWHANMIPNGQALAPGKWIDANFDDGSGLCVYDLKVVDVAGNAVVRQAENVCTMTAWTLHD